MPAGLDVEELYRRYGQVVFRRCRVLLGKEDQAMDAMQDVFIRAIRYGRSFQAERRPLPWLFQIANRVCFDRRRRMQREPVCETESLAALPGVDPERLAEVLRLLDGCDRLTREIALAYHVEEMSMEEVAEHVGRSRKTVGKRLARFGAYARERLGGRGAKEGGAR
ncbi:MAG: sigma-70 family RNA polymerase sigma factor [Deltaproteobacteria bacterium]|nr:sigma-70 family RNA polymerase sigma factor [Deltaproteobacteria bacterium]